MMEPNAILFLNGQPCAKQEVVNLFKTLATEFTDEDKSYNQHTQWLDKDKERFSNQLYLEQNGRYVDITTIPEQPELAAFYRNWFQYIVAPFAFFNNKVDAFQPRPELPQIGILKFQDNHLIFETISYYMHACFPSRKYTNYVGDQTLEEFSEQIQNKQIDLESLEQHPNVFLGYAKYSYGADKIEKLECSVSCAMANIIDYQEGRYQQSQEEMTSINKRCELLNEFMRSLRKIKSQTHNSQRQHELERLQNELIACRTQYRLLLHHKYTHDKLYTLDECVNTSVSTCIEQMELLKHPLRKLWDTIKSWFMKTNYSSCTKVATQYYQRCTIFNPKKSNKDLIQPTSSLRCN